MSSSTETILNFPILAIDDDPLIPEIYQRILPREPIVPNCRFHDEKTLLQYRLESVNSGLEAIEKIKEAYQQRMPYALIYLDMRMPEMDGMQIAERIREIDPTVMIILVTAYEDHDIVDARQKLGSNFEFLSKPVNSDELLSLTCTFASHWFRTMATLQQLQQPNVVSNNRPHEENTKPTKVMFVDDSATVRAVYSDLLRSEGKYEVAVAGDLEEAVKLARQFIPDISILDYYMPGGNGDELAKQLLGNKLTKNTLILVLTQREEVEEIMLNVGAVDILYKDDPSKIFLQRVGAMDRYIRSQMDLRASIETQTRIASEQEKSRLQANEAKLRRQWLESIISTIPVGLLVLDNNQTIQQVNQKAIKLMGYHNENLIGMHISELLEEEDRQAEFDCRVRCEDGSTIPVSISRAALESTGNEQPGEVVIIHDLRERIAMEQERATQANQLAYQSGLSEMSSNVLHNIGNTIAGMSWQVIAMEKSIKRLQSIQQGLEVGIEIDDIERLHAGLQHALNDLTHLNNEELTLQIHDMGRSIEYVGEVIRIQQSVAQVQSLYMKSFDLAEAIQDVLLIERETNRKHDVNIEYRIAESLPQVSLPYNQFMQLLGNLIKNCREAIQEQRTNLERPDYSGEIMIEVTMADSEFFTLAIRDNGCGIEEERLKTIFQRGESNKIKGSGFGLHSAATFIQSLGGTIHAHSNGRGAGASILIELPTEAKPTLIPKRKIRHG